MRYKSFLSFLVIPTFLLIQGCGNFSDNRAETSNEKNTLSGSSSDSGDSNRLSSRVIDELQINLTNTSSSRVKRVSSRSSSKVLSNTLTSSQIDQITTAATKAVSDAGFTSSEDLIQLMPKIIEGAQSKLSTIGISSSEETIKVINVIVNSMFKSVNGRSQYLPSSSAESGATATETIFKKITSTSVSKLDEAGLSASDIGAASSELVGTVVGSLGSAGISSSDVGGALERPLQVQLILWMRFLVLM